MTISHVGAATGTTSCTVPAHNIGDLIVIYAYRSGSTTAPSLGAGFVSISTRSGTTCSARLGFKIATATNDTSGTWTNATNLTCVVYTSSQRTTGGSLYVGTGGAVSSGTTTTVTFPAVTMAHADNTSWVAGFSGISVATAAMSTHAPSGMTFFTGSDVTSTVEVTAFDTNGVVNSWSSTNSTASNAGNWTTATLEIIENTPGAGIPANIVQSVYTAANAVISTASGNNFRIPLPNPTLSGNGLVVAVSYPTANTPAITDDKGNTWPTSGASPGTVTADAGDQVVQIFRLASATTGTKVITVGFGSTVVQPVKIWIWELFGITGTVNGTVEAPGVNTLGIVSPGSFTPTNNNANGGNLIIAVACCANGTSSVNPNLIQPESGYTLTDGDITWSGTQGNPSGSQVFVQATSAATTPQFYFQASGTQTYNVAAMALSLGTQGTQKAAGIHIDAIRYLSCAGNPASLRIQIPSSGNLGVTTGFSFSGTNALPDLTAIVDSDGTSWTRIDPSPNNTPVFYHNPNQTPKSYRTATLTLGGGTGLPMQVVYYDISGAATSPLGATGFQQFPTLNGSNTASAASVITATATNGLFLGFIQLGLGPSTTLASPAGGFADLPTYDTATGTGSITATTMTISSTTWGAFGGANNLVAGPNVAVGTSIVSGAGPFTINPSQTAASGAITQKQFDSDTMSFGNFAGHYYNGSDLSAQTWTVNITNQGTATGGNFTVAEFKAAPTSTVVTGWLNQNPDLIKQISRTHVGPSAVFAPPQPPPVLIWQSRSNWEIPKRPTAYLYASPNPAFVARPEQILGWGSFFPDIVPKAKPAPDNQSLVFDPQTIVQAIVTGWLSNQDYVPKRYQTNSQFEPFTAFGTPPRVVTGWGPSYDYAPRGYPPRAPESFMALGQPPFQVLGWNPSFPDVAPGNRPRAAESFVVEGQPPIVPVGWWQNSDYVPKRTITMAHFEPAIETFGYPPIIATGWWPTFPDFSRRGQTSPDFPFLSWTPQTIQQGIITGWYPAFPDFANARPPRVDSPALVIGQPPFQVLGWNPSFEIPVQPASRVHLFPHSMPYGQFPIAPPVVIVGWIVIGADFAPGKINTEYYLAPIVPVVPPFVPPPPPFVAVDGVFRVSGGQVIDRFPVTGVSYNYAPITQRTD